MAKRKSDLANQPSRVSVDWKYLLFYTFFYLCLVLIAEFGVIAET